MMYSALRLAWRTLAISLVIGLSIPICQSAEPGSPRPARPRPPRASTRQPEQATTPTATTAKLEVIPGVGGAKVIAMEFYDLDIDHLLRLLSYAAQVTIVKSEQVTGNITVIAPEPVELEVAFQILDSVLEVRGFTMVRSATGIYKVLPIAEAVKSGVPINFGAAPGAFPPGDDVRTQVIPLENLDANDLAAQLEGMLSENASVIPTSTNSLIITDTASNIHLAMELIADVEGQLSGGLKVYPLQYYDATEMSDLVTSIVLSRGGAGGAGQRPAWERRVVGRGAAPARQAQQRRPTPQPQTAAAGPEFAYPDTRTNSLIVLATPIHLRQIEDLVVQLDRPVSLRDAFFVYPVQNLVASDLAQLLAPLIGAQVTTGAGDTGGLRSGSGGSSAFSQRRQQSTSLSGAMERGSRRTSSLPSSQLPGQAVRTTGVAVEPLAGGSTGARSADPLMIAQAPEGAAPPAPQPAPAPAAPPAQGPEGPEITVVDYEEPASLTGAGVAQAVIAADDNTNALLISAPPEQIDLIQQMLEKLDVLPPQVHIRAIIAEVELSRDTDLGFQWQSLGRIWGNYEGDTFSGDVGTNFGGSFTTEDGAPTGIFATLTGPEFQAVLTALTTDAKARILSAPSIFTTSNNPATIDISKQLPFPTGTFQSTTGAGAISTSISYRSVGIVLSVTPRVTQGDVVQMEVEISANEPGSEVVVADLSYPSFNQRLATAVVSVMNGNTVVVGGLMYETIGRSASRVPILGDLPLVGTLFRSTQSTRRKSELLLFLTPRIVRTPGEAAAITESERSRLPDVPKSLQSVVAEEQPPIPPSALVPPEPGLPSTDTFIPEQPMADEATGADASAPEAAPGDVAEEGVGEDEPVAAPPDAIPVEEAPAESQPPLSPPE